MSIIYCDYLLGDDTTGSGTNIHPYKTITKASTSLTGGDEVRVAKSVDTTTMSGTLAWVDGSTSITTSADLTGVLSPGDFVCKDTIDNDWWEAITITDTTLTLFRKYSGTTATVSSKKLGITSTGLAVSWASNVQTISSSGSSVLSRLKISGGWDLSTETQDGQTYFRQMHTTFAARYGRGLYMSSKSYIEMDHLHFLRYDNCIQMFTCSWCKVTSPILLGAGDECLYIASTSTNNEIINPICNGNVDVGIYITTSFYNTITNPICHSSTDGIRLYTNAHHNTITTPTCNGNSTNGVFISSSNNTITAPTCNGNGTQGIYLVGANFNCITDATCNDSNYGIFISSAHNNIIFVTNFSDNNYGVRISSSLNTTVNGFSGTNTLSDIYAVTMCGSEKPAIKMQHFKTVGDNRCYYEYGITYRDTANARSGECLKFDPSSATYYISQPFNFTAASGIAQTLSAYVKDDASFNGDIQAAIYFMGVKITGWTEWTPTTSYVKKEIIAAAVDITEDGVLELKIKVRGAAGNVFVDDLETA